MEKSSLVGVRVLKMSMRGMSIWGFRGGKREGGWSWVVFMLLPHVPGARGAKGGGGPHFVLIYLRGVTQNA